jgi:hypothetical protein
VDFLASGAYTAHPELRCKSVVSIIRTFTSALIVSAKNFTRIIVAAALQHYILHYTTNSIMYKKPHPCLQRGYENRQKDENTRKYKANCETILLSRRKEKFDAIVVGHETERRQNRQPEVKR